MTESRKRHTFRFRSDDSDDEPLAMDEQEQEELIAKLTKENDEKNDEFLRYILMIPAVSWIAFLRDFVVTDLAVVRLVSLVAFCSIVLTGYNLLFIPTSSRQGRDPPKFAELKARMKIPVPQKLSPAQEYVPLLNGILSVLIAFWGLTLRHKRGVPDHFWLVCWVPAVDYIMIQLARKWMVEVSPEELEKLKYEFRGA